MRTVVAGPRQLVRTTYGFIVVLILTSAFGASPAPFKARAAVVPAFVRSVTATATAGTTISATFSGGATASAGDLLVVVVGANGNATITGPQISPGNPWPTAINESGTNASQGIFYKIAGGGESTFSASVNANPGSIAIQVFEYSGATTLMQAVGASTGNTTAPTTGTVTTTVANELILAAFTIDNTRNISDTSWNDAGEGFSERTDVTTSGGGGKTAGYAAGDNLSNSAGAHSVATAFASGTKANWRAQIVRFQGDVTAPAAISDLALDNATPASIRLTWTAPGDDGTSGTANGYDIRYSTSSINEGNWASATQVVGEPSPAVAGTSQTTTVSGLSSSTTYYFAMKTSDEVSNTSSLSNVPSLATTAPADTTAPAAVSDLAVSGPTVSSLHLSWTAPGDDGTSGTAASYDIRRSNAPITNDTEFNAATQITGEPTPAVAGTAQSMDVTGLSSGTTYYFAMKTSDEVPNVSVLSNSPGGATSPPPDTTAPAAVSDLALSNATTSSIRLTWTAPGDDGTSGTASLYDIHYSTSPITNQTEYDAATDVTPSPPAPAVAGTVQSLTVTGLSASTTYYFAIETYDEVPNISALSNAPGMATLTPADTTAPDAVTDLATSNPTTTSLDLTWTAPGDDGATGTATSYDIRYSTSAINDGNWAAASQVSGEPAPMVAGSVQSMTVGSLSANTTYYFAMKTSDEAPNVSALSNVKTGTTAAAADTTPPAAIADLALSGATTNSIDLTWTAPGDDGATGTATSYDIRYSSEYAITTDAIFNGATQVVGEPLPAAAGTVQTLKVNGLTPNTNYHFAIKTSDEAPNVSGLSNSPSLSTLPLADVTAPSAVSDLALSGATPDTIHLAWTAPGDDGTGGTASYYDIRYSTSAITDGNWGSATTVTGEPVPAAGGTSQSMDVTGLSANTTYYFAMKTSDEVPNTSTLSNVPSLATLPSPDTTAPAAVTDLAISNPTTVQLKLTWTAPGDDGASGTATSYDIRYSTAPINGNWASATQVAGEPAPAAAGTVQTMYVNSLSPGTTYYFAMKTSDEVPNVSGISNVPSLATLPSPDTTAPAAVTDLALSGATTTSLTLSWTAPGDDGASGTATSYDIRYSTSSIVTNSDFAAATQVAAEPAPAAAGTVQTMTVGGLVPGTTYFFALETRDEVPNISSLSNVPSSQTTVPAGSGVPAGGSLADLAIEVSASPYNLPEGGGDVTFTYHVMNLGDVHIGDVQLRGDLGSIPCAPKYVSGDSDLDGGLDPGTEWTYSCTAKVTASGIHTAQASGFWNYGRSPSPSASVVILVGTVSASANFDLVARPYPSVLHAGGGEATVLLELTNLGASPLSDVVITGGGCALSPLLEGDEDHDGLLDADELWKYSCKGTYDRTTDVEIVATVRANGALLRDVAKARVNVGTVEARPNIHLHVQANPAALPVNGGKTYLTYHVTNDGTVPLDDVTLAPGSPTCKFAAFGVGDKNGDKRLDLDETWTYTCVEELDETEADAAVAKGRSGSTWVTDDALFIVPVATMAPPAQDRNAVGPFDPRTAGEDSPDLDTALDLPAAQTPFACIIGVPYKVASDGDKDTQEDSTVYYCGRDGKRHVFPSAKVFASWYPDYSNVVVISRADLEALPLGGAAVYKPGSRMLKSTTDAKVYAVARYGVLRWVPTEALAAALYGSQWRTLIDDLPAPFWKDYAIGEPVQ